MVIILFELCARTVIDIQLGTGTVDFVCPYRIVLNFNLLICLLSRMFCVYISF